MKKQSKFHAIILWFISGTLMITMPGLLHAQPDQETRAWMKVQADRAQKRVTALKKDSLLKRLVYLYRETQDLRTKAAQGNITDVEQRILDRRMRKIKRGLKILGISILALATIAGGGVYFAHRRNIKRLERERLENERLVEQERKRQEEKLERERKEEAEQAKREEARKKREEKARLERERLDKEHEEIMQAMQKVAKQEEEAKKKKLADNHLKALEKLVAQQEKQQEEYRKKDLARAKKEKAEKVASETLYKENVLASDAFWEVALKINELHESTSMFGIDLLGPEMAHRSKQNTRRQAEPQISKIEELIETTISEIRPQITNAEVLQFFDKKMQKNKEEFGEIKEKVKSLPGSETLPES